MHNYHDSKGSFPQGYAAYGTWGPLVMMLPYIEQANLFNGINFVSTFNANSTYTRNAGGPNTTVAWATINAFLCPSDPDRLTTPSAPQLRLLHGIGRLREQRAVAIQRRIRLSPRRAGPLRSRVSPMARATRSVPASGSRGSAPTQARLTPSRPSSSFSSNMPSTINASGVSPQAAYTACKALRGPTSSAFASGGDPLGGYWTDAEPSQEMYNHVMTPNLWSCSTNTTNYNGVASSASSRHSGGINNTFMDGSVKFIKDSINPTTWWALGTKSGSEVIDASSY